LTDLHYLDYAATTPVSPAVAQVMAEVMVAGFGNPSSQYTLGRQARTRLEADRSMIAGALGCRPEQLTFTSCGTEGNNWAIQAALHQNRRVGKHIITTAVEHNAVLAPLKELQKQGYEVTLLKPDAGGQITAAQVAEALREDTALVSVMLVNNETGCIFPVAEIARLLKERKSAALLHTDAVQAFLKLPFTADSLGADFISLSGHKIGGPKGVGALYIGPRVKAPRPLLYGGGQENGRRSGTEATAQIAGFAEAVRQRLVWNEANPGALAALRQYAVEQLKDIPCLRFIGGGADHILCLSLEGYPSQNIVNELDSAGVCISAGSACHKGAASHVLTAMGLPKKVAAGAVRVSFGPETTTADIDALARELARHQATRFPMF